MALLPSCCFKSIEKGAKHTFFIQVPLSLPAITEMQDALTPVINEILQEELGKKQDKNFPIFFFKKRQAIAIYYINDLYDSGEPLKGILYLFLFPVLYTLQYAPAPEDVTISANLDFFGQAKPGLFSTIELVVLIDDPSGELAFLNKEMKKAAHHANGEYKRAYHTDLYDVTKSEKFPYLPHLSLGHLRLNYIRYLINDPSKETKVIERIKQRIKKEVENALTQIPLDDRKATIDKLAVYDLQKKKYIEDVKLGGIH